MRGQVRAKPRLLRAQLRQDGRALRPGGVAREARAQVQGLVGYAGRRVVRRQQDVAQLLSPEQNFISALFCSWVGGVRGVNPVCVTI